MSEIAQSLVVVVIVAFAAWWLVHRLRGMARGEVACGKCAGCGTTEARCDADEPPAGVELPPAIRQRNLVQGNSTLH